MSPINVLVCGTNYGRMYLEAVRLRGTRYRLVGILGRGSSRSQQVALEFGVPLYRCVEEVTPRIDLACAAMGASGFDQVLRLIARGVHVLCEHPQKPTTLQSALKAASSAGLCFHVNGHFVELEAARAFIHKCRQLSQTSSPSFFCVTATDRSLYAALDILHRFTSFSRSQFQVATRVPPFTIIKGFLGSVPTTMHLQCDANGGRLPDGSVDYIVDHRIAVSFPSGTITLLSMNGPVVWNANLNGIARPSEHLFTIVHNQDTLTAGLLHKERVAANLGAIEALVKNMHGHITPFEQSQDHLLRVSRAWETIGGLL